MNVMKVILAVIRTILTEFVDRLLRGYATGQGWG